jgi:hypothetical protein
MRSQLPLLTLLALLSGILAGPALAAKVIIMTENTFEEVGIVEHGGRRLVLFPIGRQVEADDRSTRVRYEAVVWQPDTDAVGSGRWQRVARSERAGDDFDPITIRADTGSRFEPGEVLVFAHAELIVRGRVVDSWSWKRVVMLVAE